MLELVALVLQGVERFVLYPAPVGQADRRACQARIGPVAFHLLTRLLRDLREVSLLAAENAATVFCDELLLSMPDDEHGGGEERWISQGRSLDGKCLIVVHTIRELDDHALVRIISARRATSRERRRYEPRT